LELVSITLTVAFIRTYHFRIDMYRSIYI